MQKIIQFYVHLGTAGRIDFERAIAHDKISQMYSGLCYMHEGKRIGKITIYRLKSGMIRMSKTKAVRAMLIDAKGP